MIVAIPYILISPLHAARGRCCPQKLHATVFTAPGSQHLAMRNRVGCILRIPRKPASKFVFLAVITIPYVISLSHIYPTILLYHILLSYPHINSSQSGGGAASANHVFSANTFLVLRNHWTLNRHLLIAFICRLIFITLALALCMHFVKLWP